ncbi:MAG: glycosyltransferase family 2 protein [Desulfovibrionaceae bacterium]|nr:glycosyltransferase family 2 protein [Desulfovibrionaceae bacterium]
MTVWILLPAFNETLSIPKLFPRIRESFDATGLSWRIALLDDGSTDDILEVLEGFKEYPLDILRHSINRGLGETERDLFEYAAAHAAPDDVAIRLDCDDTHDPRFFISLIRKLEEGNDVVIASRFQPGGGQDVTGGRLFLTHAAALWMRLFFPIDKVRDYSCGFRAYRIRALRDAITIFGNNFIQLKGLGFTSTLETIVKLSLLGARFAEIPFVLHYSRKLSLSKMYGSVTTLGYVIMTMLYWWPFGGWRSCYRGLAALYRRDSESAVRNFSSKRKRRPTMSSPGGGT